MRIENKTSTFQDIKRGVRQGCVLSPDLFSLCSEIIMRNLENHPGIKVGGQNINNLRYADDTVLISENKEDLQKLLNIFEEESRKKGLELNSKKTEMMLGASVVWCSLLFEPPEFNPHQWGIICTALPTPDGGVRDLLSTLWNLRVFIKSDTATRLVGERALL
ncbi:retrovirus-related pol polyprotein from type-1 retrotransposable element r2 [Plakobranchus ocellatus]|uniref:Retrovirus-related pol polyprotein from type-1 retrotransposable element r2 n=1 Tax=Plakobranchus ocellatus TaxID=259542 RepID=A0AAV4BFF1_9GAST|nr:retrovirus-related pol polyprotein from type-1 retrotransposable element r2 [Plakobranchus ocellatus]